ncbi:PTS sugar transporter subunit IIC [Caldifermentibacillus hisashii]|uniref:PTS mannose/fructose/sorbose/N-acetylgalactosamine transporter subunit IIC n=1 Tax=Caldifermentibacillus hisashii TaxID=996558 RepID=UPI002DFC51D3|nr:PTS sugar transporter subunit IIC [Caldifermentibacillus hisashii]
MLTTAILLALIAFFANLEFFFGTSLLTRPIITGTLTGIVMGDLKTGIIMGATLELAFLGAISIGAVIPPDITSGGILGTAFAISTGGGAKVALALGLPIATLVLVFTNLAIILIVPMFGHRADKYALEADTKSMERMFLLGGFIRRAISPIIVGFAFYLGSPFMNNILEKIPDFVQDGLSLATGLLPALGFAMLMQLLLTKKTLAFFLLGFALYAYLKIPVTGVAIFAGILTFVLLELKNSNRKIAAEIGVDNDEDDF